MGANDAQTIRTLLEAESYPGPSLVIAYSHCIAHGIDMRFGMTNQKLAVQSGHWPLFRFDPRRVHEGKNPLQLDSKPPSISVDKYLYAETRFKMLQKALPERARQLLRLAQGDVDQRWRLYSQLAALQCNDEPVKPPAPRTVDAPATHTDAAPRGVPESKTPVAVEGET